MGRQQEEKDSAGSKHGGKKGLLIGLAAAALTAVCIAVLLASSGVLMKSKALLSALELLGEESPGLDLDLSVEIDGTGYDVEAEVRNTLTQEGVSVSRITYQGLSLYYAQGAVFLEDGTAWRLAEDAEDSETSLSCVLDYAAILSLIRTWYAEAEVSVSEEDGLTVYSITLDEEASLELLAALYPPAAEQISGMSALSVDLYAENGTASAIVISGGAAVGGSAAAGTGDATSSDEEDGDHHDASAQSGTSLAVDVRMDILTGEDGSFLIPDVVLTALAAGDYTEAPVLTQELLQLLAAWNELRSRERIEADISIGIDLGPLSLHEDMTWVRSGEDGEALNRITIEGKTWTFTDEWLAFGADEAEEEEDTAAAAAIDPLFLLDTAYEVFMEGGFSVGEEDGSSIYTVSLTQEQMETIILTLLPEAEDLGISYKDCQFTAAVTDDELTSLALTGGGSVKVLLSAVSVDLTVDIDLH